MQSPIKNKASTVSYMGIFTAVLATLSFFESRFGINFGVPGVKFGLSNIVIILSLYMFGMKNAFMLTVLKILFSLLFTSGLSGFLFTALGSVSSVSTMYIVKRILKSRVTAVGVSVAGGFSHITAQYICSGFVLGTFYVFKIYPVAAALSLLTSAVTGLICNLLLERMYKK